MKTGEGMMNDIGALSTHPLSHDIEKSLVIKEAPIMIAFDEAQRGLRNFELKKLSGG